MSRNKINIAIPKLKQHADKVLCDLGFNCSTIEFVDEYKKQFREEYLKYEHGYNSVLRQQKAGKGTPPSPEKYLALAYNNAVARHKKEETVD
ncbi:hypothetical protein RBG61_11800 [Paludicola sp. MB14-C6]|uniref:hypothetical protein n=1 Tax=Paludihabitans sp. MB14-C6 TaxID=3070656 RepID=UPI0027DE6D96|nr:hypothetical protein [Paludicola sp. MB14-C6]WMJ22666.1 hypothetical protein RBG61_11800 [Paludicola sp. MB14-C6]